MADTPISFDNPVHDDGMNAAFARGAAEGGGRRHVPTADPDPDPAHVLSLLPPYVTAPPRRGVPRDESGQ